MERLSVILTLHDIGFTTQEAETYMCLLLENRRTEKRRLAMLEGKRSAALDADGLQRGRKPECAPPIPDHGGENPA